MGSAPAACVLVAGSLMTGFGAALVSAAVGAPAANRAELARVRAADLDAAAASLDPVAGKQAAEEARGCKAPLAVVALSAAGAPGATVRVRSGAYVSPPIRLAAAAHLVAVPFPAPYPAGQGMLRVEGTGRDVSVSLQPGWRIASLDGVAEQPVVWTPLNPG